LATLIYAGYVKFEFLLYVYTAVIYFRNKQGIAKNTEDIELLKAMVKELEQKSIETDEQVSDLRATTDSTTFNVANNHRTFIEICDDYKE